MMTTYRFLTIVLSFFFSAGLYAQSPATGSRLPEGGGGQPINVVRLQQPREISEIRQLASAGKAAEARKAALAYVAKVEKSGQDAATRYFAYNALCVVYTQTGEMDKAESQCSRAIDLLPWHWEAHSNRGTVRMLAGNYEGARDDYYSARKTVDARNEDAVSTIIHNLQILDQRMQ